MKRITFLLVIVILFSMFLSGCFLTDRLESLKDGFNKGEQTNDVNIPTPTVVIETPDTTTPVVTEDTRTIALYFSDESGNNLVLEERSIPKVTGIARAAMEELIKGPTQTGLKSALPVNTKLLDINVRPDGLAIVDFSGDLIKDLPASETAENLAVYSIVNTLTQFPTVEKVEMRVDGKRIETLLGYVDLNQDLVRNTSLIK